MRAIKFGLIRSTVAVAVLAIASLAIVPLNASAKVTAESASYSQSKLKQLIRGAHTRAQYENLAIYFRSQELTLRNKAAAAQEEWERRQALGVGPGRKFPASADSARNLYEYYTDKADEMATRAAGFEMLAR